MRTSPLIAGLLRPEAYPHPAKNIELRETHVSWVLLAGAYAYKIKKPVDFGFLDFTTFEQRAANAEAEVRLNRRLSPSVYLGTVDVVERDGSIAVVSPPSPTLPLPPGLRTADFGLDLSQFAIRSSQSAIREGQVLERAVWMRRLPDDGMLGALLQRGQARHGLFRRIARRMAAFHTCAPTGPGVDEWAALPNLQANWEDNFTQIAPHVDVTVPADELAAIEAYVRRFLRERRGLLDARVASGRVRDGHGDLHADSICLLGRQLVIFDCLEFSARYRCADVAAEIAFLAMDLEHVGRPDLSWAFVSEYVRVSGDRELLDLLDFYRCYRAFVRGKVRSLRVGQASSEEAARVRAEARSYFDLAARYALWSAGACSRFRPRLVVTCGLPAVGKTTLAQRLAERLGLLCLSTDVVRKTRAGLRPTQRAGSAFSAGLYSAEATQRTYTALRRRAGLWLRRGVSVVLGGTFGSRRERQLAAAVARRAAASFRLVLVRGDEGAVKRRMRARAEDPATVSDATWEVYQRMRDGFEPPSEVRREELIVDETGGEGADEVVARLLSAPSADEKP